MPATRKRRQVIAAILLVALVALGAFNAPSRIENRLAPRATIESLTGGGVRTPEEQTYLDGLKPFLDVLVGEGRALEKLGNERSRNIVELSVRMDRYRTAAKQIDQYIRDAPAPSGLTQFVSELREQIAMSLSAIDASVTAVRQFDWDALGKSVDGFSKAVEQIAFLAGTPVAINSQ